MREAKCKTDNRNRRATMTGFGSVLVMKFTRVSKCGRMLENRGPRGPVPPLYS